MSPRILIAGIGSDLLGDEGFGVAAARRLARGPAPDGVTVSEFGLRSLHLASAMLERPDLLLIIDAVRRGEAPGTIYLIDVSALAGAAPRESPATFGMSIDTVVTACWTLGGKAPPMLLVGCEPERVGKGGGLSPPVAAALPRAEQLVRVTVGRWLGRPAGQPIGGITKSSQDGVWFPSVDG